MSNYDPDKFFAEVRDMYLPVLTQYHASDGDEPTYPWISNWKLGLQSGHYTDLEAAVSADVYPEQLFQKSQIPNREHGYALWDFIIRNGRTTLRNALDQGDARGIVDGKGSFEKSANSNWWVSNVAQAYMHGKLNELPYTRDFLQSDWSLVEAAHALAHRQGDDSIPAMSYWRSYAHLSKTFAQYLAELYIASEFGVPIDIHKPPGQTLAWGIVGHPTLRYGFAAGRPVLQMPYSYALPPDRDFAHVSVAIVAGADPLSVIVPGAEAQEEDRLAYQPRRLMCVGWALSSWVYCQELRWTERMGWATEPKASFTSLCDDLFAPQWFSVYLEAAKRNGLGYTTKHRKLEDWKEDLDNLTSMTSMLPCDHCLLFNRGIENGIQMAPRKWKLKTADPIELKQYKDKLKQAIRLVVKANALFYGKDYRKMRKLRRERHKNLRRKRRSAKCKTTDPYGYSR